MCDCGADEETVVHLLFHCNKHEQVWCGRRVAADRVGRRNSQVTRVHAESKASCITFR